MSSLQVPQEERSFEHDTRHKNVFFQNEPSHHSSSQTRRVNDSNPRDMEVAPFYSYQDPTRNMKFSENMDQRLNYASSQLNNDTSKTIEERFSLQKPEGQAYFNNRDRYPPHDINQQMYMRQTKYDTMANRRQNSNERL